MALSCIVAATLLLAPGAAPDDATDTDKAAAPVADAADDADAAAVPGDTPATPEVETPDADAEPGAPSGPDAATEPGAGGSEDVSGLFFGDDTAGAPKPEAPSESPPKPELTAAPAMPEIEELPPKPGTPEPTRRKVFDMGKPDRAPAGSDGGSFFDPGKIADTGPSGGAIQIRGFVAANFFVAQRSNTLAREDDGSFRKLKTLPYFDLSSATLYVGAPIYADVVYARIGFEFISTGAVQPVAQPIDISGQTRRFVAFETGALEINPFALADRTARWFREGFKITAGVFILPFGLEDEEHASPVNWFITRPLAMTNNRVYPGTWSDVGASLKWKPTFGKESPIRPIEIDVGVVNGDACSQTRFLDTLFGDPSIVATCERQLRTNEAAEQGRLQTGSARINAPGGFILPDNNGGKSVVARVQVFPIGSVNAGGSFVWGTHPASDVAPSPGESAADLDQAASWRLGTHLELNFEEMFESPFPLPHLRGEFVMGRDEAVEREVPVLADRSMRGVYAQIAQPLFRRKKTRLPGLILQYRFDQADPDVRVPSVVSGVDANGNPLEVRLESDLGTTRRETAFQSHTVGFRFPILPRFTLKTEYTFVREDGGSRNQVANDIFGFEAVADF